MNAKTLAHDPQLPVARKLMLLPRCKNWSTDIREEHCARERTEMLLARATTHAMLVLPPERQLPSSDTLDPMRAQPRKEIHEPSCKKLNTDIRLPVRTEQRMDKLLPVVRNPPRDRPWPTLQEPIKLTFEPTRQNVRRLREEPMHVMLKTLNELPNREKLRKDTLDATFMKPVIDNLHSALIFTHPVAETPEPMRR
jgi:hypothetical protein